MMEKVNLVWSKTNRWHRGLLLLLLVELRVLPGGQIGFTCNDPALSHPFTGDTISWKWLMATAILLPLAVMLIVERNYHSGKVVKPKQQALCWYKEYLYGVLLNLIIVQTLKLLVGSPRPHFFDTCDPQEANTCIESEYVSSYTCTKAHWISQSDKSFPSGHTSLAVHTGIFLVYYLYRRTAPVTLGVLSVQLVFIGTAFVCCLSRMTDHRHHWWDVLAGVVIAIPILYYTIYSLCGSFKCSQETIEDPKDCDKTDHALLVTSKET